MGPSSGASGSWDPPIPVEHPGALLLLDAKNDPVLALVRE
jgi:hypothetical protein